MRLLQIELYKLWHNTISKVLIFGYFLLILSISILSTIKIDLGPVKFYLAEQGIFNFPYIWHFNTFMIALLKIFFAIIIVAMIGNEYSYKTLKQNLIDGLSKSEFLRSKIYAILLFVLTSTLLVFIVSLILGGIYSDYNEMDIIFKDLEYLVAYSIKLFGFFTFCLFLSILIKMATTSYFNERFQKAYIRPEDNVGKMIFNTQPNDIQICQDGDDATFTIDVDPGTGYNAFYQWVVDKLV